MNEKMSEGLKQKIRQKTKTLPIWEGDYWRDRYNKTKAYSNSEVSSMIDDYKDDVVAVLNEVELDNKMLHNQLNAELGKKYDATKQIERKVIDTEKLRNPDEILTMTKRKFAEDFNQEIREILAVLDGEKK